MHLNELQKRVEKAIDTTHGSDGAIANLVKNTENGLKPGFRYQFEKTQLKPTLKTLVDKLKSMGFEKLGAGNFSDVWGRPNDKYVIKFNRQSDEGFLAFVQYAKKNWQSNPHLPRVYRIWKVDQYFCVVLERLDQLTSIEDRDLKKAMLKMADYLSEEDDSLETINPVTLIKTELRQCLSSINVGGSGSYGMVDFFGIHTRDKARVNRVATRMLRYMKDAKGIVAFVQFLKRQRMQSRYADLHSDNIMIRHGKFIVFTDPLA